MVYQVNHATVEWPVAGTTSKAFNTQGMKIVGFKIPSGFSGATLALQMCEKEDGVYVPVTGFSAAITAGEYYPISNLALTAGIPFCKLVSGSSEAAGRKVIVMLWGAQ